MKQNSDMAAIYDADLPTDDEQELYREAHKGRPNVYPLVAEYDGVALHSTIAPADLTGVLFHQSATPWAHVLATLLPEADVEQVSRFAPVRVNRDQLEGEWLDAEALHIWRSDEETEMDTSIDLGAPAGCAFRSPVSGTVIHLREYDLYDEVKDIEVHIQPDGRPDLDIVIIHTTDMIVQVGDRVEGGVTEIGRVRDIASSLTDIQLYYYTQGDDPGNHVHVQVNDVNYPGYRTQRLEGALQLG